MGFEDEINYEKISQLNKKERQKAKLIDLDSEFYQILINHLNKLQEEYNKRFIESPTSTEALLLNNEVCKLDAIIKEIYKRRERKILLSALEQSSIPDSKNMLDHELKLYNSISKILTSYREEILEQKPNPVCSQLDKNKLDKPPVEKTTPEQPDSSTDNQTEDSFEEFIEDNNTDTQIDHNEEIIGSKEISESDTTEIETDENIKNDNSAEESTIVHVLTDIEPFVGTDMVTYKLHKEDIVTIPKQIAQLLEKNKKVRSIETTI